MLACWWPPINFIIDLTKPPLIWGSCDSEPQWQTWKMMSSMQLLRLSKRRHLGCVKQVNSYLPMNARLAPVEVRKQLNEEAASGWVGPVTDFPWGRIVQRSGFRFRECPECNKRAAYSAVAHQPAQRTGKYRTCRFCISSIERIPRRSLRFIMYQLSSVMQHTV